MSSDPFDAFVPTRERIAAPFTREAERYVALGWYPMPIKGKSSVLSGWTGAGGEVTPEKVRKHLISRAMGYDNLGLRHDGTVAIDIDTREGKRGHETLERFRVEHNLPHLPPAPSSTARGPDTQCRQYFFRLREYRRLEHKPRVDGKQAEDVEICQYHHRFSAVYPSVHPDPLPDPTYYWYEPGTGGLTWGQKTLEIPAVESLPYLPDEWVEALTKNLDSELDLDADVVDANSLISSFRDGEPSPPVRTAIEEANTQHPGHDETYRAMFKALRYGREGHPGVKNLIAVLYARHKRYLETEHPDRARKGEADAILRDASTKAQQTPVENTYRPYTPLIPLGGNPVSVGPDAGPKPLVTLGKTSAQSSQRITSGAAQATNWDEALAAGMVTNPPEGSEHVLPDWVWDMSVELATIRKAALCRMVSPDVVLHACLATISSLVHHESFIEGGKGPGKLNYIAAAVGRSGTGKTQGLKCAEHLMREWREGQIAQLGADGYKRAEIGSGEGMVEAFMGDTWEFDAEVDEHGDPLYDDDTGEPRGKPRKVRTQVRHNAMFVADEGRQLLALANRSGATIMGVLCSMWSGASAGALNAKADNSRQVAEDSYSLGMLMGFQPATMDELFTDIGGGAPQRFAFASAVHPGITADEVDWPGSLSPKLPPWAPIRMELSRSHRTEVRQYFAAIGNGSNPDEDEFDIDGHRMLLRIKTAGLLALLHSQTYVSDEMWDLAKVIVDTSCVFRDHLAGRSRRAAEEAARRKAEMQVKTNVTSALMVEQSSRVSEVADLIVDKLGTAADGELPRREVKNGISVAKRKHFDAAVELAVTEGRIVADEVLNPSTNRKTAVLRLTDTEE